MLHHARPAICKSVQLAKTMVQESTSDMCHRQSIHYLIRAQYPRFFSQAKELSSNFHRFSTQHNITHKMNFKTDHSNIILHHTFQLHLLSIIFSLLQSLSIINIHCITGLQKIWLPSTIRFSICRYDTLMKVSLEWITRYL